MQKKKQNTIKRKTLIYGAGMDIDKDSLVELAEEKSPVIVLKKEKTFKIKPRVH